MKLSISINNIDLSNYGLTPLEGTLNVLLKPAPTKKLILNENDAIDGVIALATPTIRHIDKRDITLSFLLSTPSLTDLQRQIDRLQADLMAGYNNSGINLLYIAELDTTYGLIFTAISTCSIFGINGKATIAIRFTEPNPLHRQP